VPPQRSFYLCAADCLRKHAKASDETVAACTQTCQAPMQNMHQTCQGALEREMQRVQRGIATCQDDASMADAVSAATTAEAQNQAMRAAMEPCVVKEFAGAMDRIETSVRPALEKRLTAMLKEHEEDR